MVAGGVGLWMVGARGSIATCVAYGLAGLARGWLEPLGIVTATEPLASLDLPGFDRLVPGGWDVCTRDLSDTVAGLVREGVLSERLVASAAAEGSDYVGRLRPGILDEVDVGLANLDPEAARRGSLAPREQVAALVADLEAFRAEHGLARVVVVDVASVEPRRTDLVEGDLASLAALEAALDAGRSLPASVLYAYAALRAGCPFVEFTPNAGASSPALRELALEQGLPHCGDDGKTGETLLKTALAPMFSARALRVLAWQGYNMLGNRDGESLADPSRRAGKLRNKDEVLRQLVAPRHTHVAIDYVPSLGDWKTAWDFIHFEGFLGARMSMQVTWQGCDSALAAPLVIDLVRLAAFAADQGEAGPMAQAAAFFKSPLTGGTHDLHAQHEALLAYAREHLARR